jgi:LuxR family transcriptional regulator, maltose regulon positive regulatory protein
MLRPVSSAVAANIPASGHARVGRRPQRSARDDNRAVTHARRLPFRRPAGLVPRPRLVRRLQHAHEVPLALLVAPAGYGKTTLLTEWAERDPRPFAWIRTFPSLIDTVEHLRHPTVLVLDDASTLPEAEAFPVLNGITEAMPAGSQLALATREEPALAVGRMRAHRKVVELRAEDLAMGRTEASTLLAEAGLRLADHDVDTLVTRTEGWPAGLYLASLSLGAQSDAHAAVERFAGDDRLVADYLRDEFLAQLSNAESEFVLRTAVLETLTASVCDAVLDSTGSGRMLADLARSNVLLVPLDRTGESYRYHPLFAEMLRAELRRMEPDLETHLHRRASAWYAAGGDTQLAIRHAVAADDVDAAAAVVWPDAADRIARGENQSVRRWLAEFTSEQIAASAPLALTAATSWLAEGDRERVKRRTAEAARTLGVRGSIVPASMRTALAILTACGSDGVGEMGAAAAVVRRSAPKHGPWRSTGSLLEGVSHHLAGRHGDARAALERGARGDGVSVPGVQALCLAQLALLVAEHDEWDEAAVLVSRARAQITASGLTDYPTVALVFAVSGLVRSNRAVTEEARADLLLARRLMSRLVNFMPWYEAETRIVLARVALHLHDVASARALLTEADDRLRDAPDATTLRVWFEETRTRLEAAALSAGENCALTNAELRVLELLPTHLSVPAIAARLYVSPNTVKTHVRAVYRKLHASSRAEAVACAAAAGLLDDAQAA